MNHEERDDLWELLGCARPVKIPPFFSRNVLRTLREEKPVPAGVWAWLVRRWPVVATAVCALVVAGVVWMPRPQPADSLETLAEHVTESPDYAVIGNLDELLASQESSAWLTYSVD